MTSGLRSSFTSAFVLLIGVVACSTLPESVEEIRSALVANDNINASGLQPTLLNPPVGSVAGDNQPQNLFPEKMVTLTYDDGPDIHTEELADYLMAQNIRATFFIRTCRLNGQPLPSFGVCGTQGPQSLTSVLQHLLDRGHRVANHTKNHPDLQMLPMGAVSVLDEVGGAQAVLDPFVTDGVYILRAPYNHWDSTVAGLVRSSSSLNKLVGPIGWDIDGQPTGPGQRPASDWGCFCSPPAPCQFGPDLPPDVCADNYVRGFNAVARHNGVIQLHDGLEFSVGTDRALELTKSLVPKLKALGARFVPLDALPGVTGQRTFASATFRSSDFSDTSNGGVWPTAPGYFGSIRFGDVADSADARADVCGRAPDGIWCGIGHTGGFGGASKWSTGTDFSDADGWLPPQHGTTIQLGNVGGGSKADVCGRGWDGIYCAISNEVFGFAARTRWTTDFSNAGGWDTTSSHYGSIRLADVNNDGKADICGRGWDGVYCGLNTGASGFAPVTRWTTDFANGAGWDDPKYGSTIQFADINQDGRMDVCGRGWAGILCGLGQVGGGFAPHTLRTKFGAFSDNDGWGASAARFGSITFAKVDGDAFPDVCGRTETGLVCAFGDGTSFTRYVHVRNDYFTDSLGWGPDKYGSTVRLADVTGDGRADLCGRGYAGISCSLAP